MRATSERHDKPTRRTALRTGLAWAISPALGGLARAMEASSARDRTLVLLHLSGGNDGLNTLIPYADPLYYELRPRLSRAARQAIPVNDRLAFHPALASLVRLFREGRLAVVQGVGCSHPDYSHVGSCRIWATGRTDGRSQRGWWDGVLRRLGDASEVRVVCAGREMPARMISAQGVDVRLVESQEGSPTGVNPLPYQPGQIEETLARVADLVTDVRAPALILAAVGGFDTHENQLEAHEEVLRRLADGLAAFQEELERRGVAGRVLLAAWSEFGRRAAENAAGGTDHGSAGPLFLLGKTVRGGFYGATPSLDRTDFGNLIPTVDFRTVYAALASRWLGCPAGATPAVTKSLRVV